MASDGDTSGAADPFLSRPESLLSAPERLGVTGGAAVCTGAEGSPSLGRLGLSMGGGAERPRGAGGMEVVSAGGSVGVALDPPEDAPSEGKIFDADDGGSVSGEAIGAPPPCGGGATLVKRDGDGGTKPPSPTPPLPSPMAVEAALPCSPSRSKRDGHFPPMRGACEPPGCDGVMAVSESGGAAASGASGL